MSSAPPEMKYRQIDRITSIEPGKRLTAERTLRAEEEYLKDHFPRFPVMPGVMMLEALHQAAVWLVRSDDEFQTPLVLLRETRSVKFGDFLAPDETLQITVEMVKRAGMKTTVKASATKQGRVTVSARLILERCWTGDPEHFGTDAKVLESTKQQFQQLTGHVASSD